LGNKVEKSLESYAMKAESSLPEDRNKECLIKKKDIPIKASAKKKKKKSQLAWPKWIG
jgi:hypothetical protein